MKQRFYFLAIGFLILLTLPTLDQVFGLTGRFKSTENRRIAQLPELNLKQVKRFARQFDQYYRENFGGRNALVYAYSSWKYGLLHQSPLPERVVMGKQGWFFVGDVSNNVIKQHRGLLPYSPDSIQLIVDRLVDCQQQMARRGVRLYVTVAPDSHTIYPENLPEQLKQSASPSRLDQLKQAIAQTTIPFIDVRDTLLRAKQQQVVYYKTDTHWNHMGNLIACSQLINRIKADFPEVDSAQLINYHMTKKNRKGGDLVTLFMFQDDIQEEFYELRPRFQNQPLRAENFENVENHTFGRRVTGPNSTNPKLMLLGDSFGESMVLFLGDYFAETYFARGNQLRQAPIDAEKPDILVIEIVERNIDWLTAL